MDKIQRRKFVIAGSALLAVPLASAQAAFPSKPIRIVVGYPAGGAIDTVARLIGEYMARLCGQPVTIDNRPGAGGIIGAAAVAKAAPDGYTLLLTGQYPLVNAQALVKTLPYDPNKDFAFVTPVLTGAMLFCVHKSVPAANIAQLVEHARRTPDFAIGSWAQGSQGHLAIEAINKRYGLNITHLVYKGEPQVTQDLMGGQIPGGMGSLVTMAGPIKAGHIRPIAATSGPRGGRVSMLSEVATFAEQGLNEAAVTHSPWGGVLAPSGTPPAVIAKLNDWVHAALAQPDIRSKLGNLGLEALTSTPAEFEARFRAETPLWIKATQDAGIKPE
jgi:tripartite-type tricarboxylate transporter receptor subunit TctC